jgi:GTP-binding protein
VKVRKFVDSAIVQAAAGQGGNGCVSFRREKYVPKGGPDGGDGGRGGHIILRADLNTDSLIALFFSPLQNAEHGGPGRGRKCHGRNGRDLIIKVPCGTEAWDEDTGLLLGDLVAPDQELVIAKGGKGGLGNPHWLTSQHRAPREHTEGEPGEIRRLRLELKLSADVGFIGFPNAGKSSLVARISNAHPRIAAYPFTTLNPIIGTVECDEYTRFTVADIPGLVKDAHRGVGLGDRFLRHVERAPSLAIVLDMAGSEGREPVEDYRILQDEMRRYRAELLNRPYLVIANKMDLPEAEEGLAVFRRKTKLKPLPVSAVSGIGLELLKKRLLQLVRREI